MTIGYFVCFCDIILNLIAWWMQKNPTKLTKWVDYFVRVLRHQAIFARWKQLKPTKLTKWAGLYWSNITKWLTPVSLRRLQNTNLKDKLSELIQRRGAPSPVQSAWGGFRIPQWAWGGFRIPQTAWRGFRIPQRAWRGQNTYIINNHRYRLSRDSRLLTFLIPTTARHDPTILPYYNISEFSETPNLHSFIFDFFGYNLLRLL